MRRRGRFMRDAATARRGRMARGVMRDTLTPSHNALSPAASLKQFGWIGPAISNMGNSARWACSLNSDNEVIAGTNMPLESMATTPAALLNACMIASLGNGIKNTAAASLTNGTAATIDLSTGGAIAFGARIKLSNSITNFKFSTYEFQLATTATVIADVLVEATSLPVDVVILSISNTGGKATITPDQVPKVIIPATGVNAGSIVTGDVVYCETLNMRDIGNIYNALENGAILL